MAHKRPRNQSPNAVGLDGLTWPATRQTLDWYVTRARDGPWCRKSVFSVLAAPPRRAWFEAAAAINFIPHTGGFGPVVRFVSINARPDCGAGVEVPAGTSTPAIRTAEMCNVGADRGTGWLARVPVKGAGVKLGRRGRCGALPA